MTTEASYVGATLLPLPAGRPKEKLADPIVEGLLNFLGWCLCNDLDAKLAQLAGTSETASPPDNRYAFDPTEPQGHKARFRLPALFVWWDGTSQSKQHTQLQKLRERNVDALYIFQELPSRAALELRSGLFAAVDACFTKAAERGGYPTYSYNGKTPGTTLEESIGDPNTWEWSYVGGQGIRRIGIGDSNAGNFGDRNPSATSAGQRHPAFAARFLVRELVLMAQPDSSNLTQDSPVAITHNGALLLTRTLPGPDGQTTPPSV